jgi:hypothetical protein
MEKNLGPIIAFLFVLIILVVLLVLNNKNIRKRKAINVSYNESHPKVENTTLTPVDTTNPLYGVKGWLEFFVVVNIYIAPIAFVIINIYAWVTYIRILDKYPNIVISGFLYSVVGLIFVLKWIQIGIRLREFKSGAVREAKQWMMYALAWTFLRIPIEFISGIDAEYLMPGIAKNLILGLISFSIWYSFLNVSKRIKATYPDWNK